MRKSYNNNNSKYSSVTSSTSYNYSGGSSSNNTTTSTTTTRRPLSEPSSASSTPELRSSTIVHSSPLMSSPYLVGCNASSVMGFEDITFRINSLAFKFDNNNWDERDDNHLISLASSMIYSTRSDRSIKRRLKRRLLKQTIFKPNNKSILTIRQNRNRK